MKKFFTFALAAAACLAASATVPNVEFPGIDGKIVDGAYTEANTNIVLTGSTTYNYRMGVANIQGEGTAIYTSQQVVFYAGKQYRLAYNVALEGDADCTISFLDNTINVTNTTTTWVVAPATYSYDVDTPATIDFNFVIGDANSGASFIGWALIELNTEDPEDPGTVDPNQKVAQNYDQVMELGAGVEFQFTGELTVAGVGANVVFAVDENGDYMQILLNGNMPAEGLVAGDVINGFFAELDYIEGFFPVIKINRDIFIAERVDAPLAEECEALGEATPYNYVRVENVLIYSNEEDEEVIVVNNAGVPFNMDDEVIDNPGVEAPSMDYLGVVYLNGADVAAVIDCGEDGNFYRYDVEGFVGGDERGYVLFVNHIEAVQSPAVILADTEGLTYNEELNAYEFEGSFEIVLDVMRPRTVSEFEQPEIYYILNREGLPVEYTEPITITEDAQLYAYSVAWACPASEALFLDFVKTLPVGIDAIAADQNVKVYNLQGVQVSAENLPAGLYIVNGKKVIVRK